MHPTDKRNPRWHHGSGRKKFHVEGAFPTAEAVRKSFWLAHTNIAQKWARPIHNWELILNSLPFALKEDCRFEGKVIYTKLLTDSNSNQCLFPDSGCIDFTLHVYSTALHARVIIKSKYG